MKQRYQIVEGPDGVHWLTLEPLIEDMKQAMDMLLSINPKDFSQKDNNLLDFKIASLKSATEFLNSLLTEVRLQDLRELHKDTLQ
jgi:hypothetical protein